MSDSGTGTGPDAQPDHVRATADGDGQSHTGQPRRRRRGSRGGRNRKRPAGQGGEHTSDGRDTDVSRRSDQPARKPQIGDTRPAPSAVFVMIGVEK